MPFDLFNPTPTADPASAVPGVDPNAIPVEPVAPALEPEGLDKFSSLFDNDKDDDKLDKTPSTPDEIFDPTAILADEEATSALLQKLDFSASISPETQQKLQNNDPDAMVAMVNDIGKAAYLQSLRHASALMKHHVDDRFKQQDGAVSTKITSSIRSADLATQIPEIANPIVALGVQPFIDKLQAQNPSMSSADVVAQVKDYLGELNSTFNPSAPKPKSGVAKEVDWLEELGL